MSEDARDERSQALPVTIRPATMAESAGIRQIRNQAIRESLAIWTAVEQTEAEAAEWLAPAVERGTALVAVAPSSAAGAGEAAGVGANTAACLPAEASGDVVLGFAVATPWHHYEGYARTVEDSVYLSPAAQGQGLGTRLLSALVEASQAAGDRTMIAMIEAGNRASVRLHEKEGFGVVGTIPAAGEKQGRLLDLTLMSLRLTD